MTSPTTIEEEGKGGRVPAAPGSRPSDQAPAGLDAARVDPSRGDWREALRWVFNETDALEVMAKHVGRGFPMDVDHNILSWSDWLVARIERRMAETADA